MGENWILNLNPENPALQPGSVQRLLEQEKLQVRKCILIVHAVGQGDIESLKLLKKDLENADILYRVIDFEELK